ncbi:MAG TPA: disulfide bond formation protein B [Burkholderiales bacterium]|nr:disulfide bond formation protein B [Burkholderiales bacterium]
MKPTPRIVFAATFLACAGLIAYALYLQHALGLEPCPMCILQRYAFILVGLVALAAAIHDPAAVGRRIYAALVALLAAIGAGVAIRHVWLEHNPPKIFDCGADVGYVLESFPLTEALPMIFRGTGDCTKVSWRFLGLSIAEWSLVCFSAIFVAAIFVLAMKAPRAGARGTR